MTLRVHVLASFAAISGAMSLSLGATSLHDIPIGFGGKAKTAFGACVKLWEECWKDPVKLHSEWEHTNCSLKFGMELSGELGPGGLPLNLVMEPIGPECRFGDYLKAYVHGPQGYTFGADLRLSNITKHTAEFVLPFSGPYSLNIYHHYVNGLGQADISTSKKFGNRSMRCGLEIMPTCAAYSSISEAIEAPPCDFSSDNPTRGFWQISDSQRVWHPQNCTVPAVSSREVLKDSYGVAQIAIIGSSRPRSFFFYDIVSALRYSEDNVSKTHMDMNAERRSWVI